MSNVLIAKAQDYTMDNMTRVASQCLDMCDYDIVGKRILLKANLVSAMAPEKCATTHPAIVEAVAKELYRRGVAEVIIGDSPGSLYNKGVLSGVYKVTGMANASANSGAKLNDDFSSTVIDIPQGVATKRLEIIDAFLKADAVINICKLKTHTLTGYSGAVKNFYGLIPGLTKAQLHADNPDIMKFGDLLVDIQEFAKDKTILHIIDGVDGMEGEGPTAGTPRHIGVVLASQDCYAVDSVAVGIISGDVNDIPYLKKAIDRGLLNTADITTIGESVDDFVIRDYKRVPLKSTVFELKHLPKWLANILEKNIVRKPIIPIEQCRACGKCRDHCPVHAITIADGHATIDYTKCIKCFCCHELCPFHIVKVKKPFLYRFITRFLK